MQGRGPSIRTAGAATAVLAIVAAIGMSGSCLFSTTTNFCDQYDRRCGQGQECAVDQNACIVIGGCGNMQVSPERGEVCDDGNIRDDDGCSHDCMSNEECGNNIKDEEVGELCDDGNTIDGDGCSHECQTEVCGNGQLDLARGEVCDDNNIESGDGCSASCASNEACGNGIQDMHLGEECEFADSPFPQRFDDSASCDNDCTTPMCGDGHTNIHFEVTGPGVPHFEECDGGVMGMRRDSRSCDRDCTFVECGDSHTNPIAGEQCDLGHTRDTPICDGDCTLPRCGDGHTNPNFDPAGPVLLEECDTAGDTVVCDVDCTRPRCGDGHRNQAAGEACDTAGDVGCGDTAPDCDDCMRCR
jgi:cysteine-rich repeat protein